MSIQNTVFELNAEEIVQDDDVIYDPPLVGLILSAVGTLEFVNGRGEAITFVVPAVAAGGALPYTLWGQITKIMEATTIADADMTGLRVSSVTPAT